VAKYFVLLILPIGTDVADPAAVERVASEMMRPFEMWQEDVPAENGH